MSQVTPDPPLGDGVPAPNSLCATVAPKVFVRDDEDDEDDEDDDMKGYDHNFVETDKFEYIMPVNDTKNFLYDPYVTSAVVFCPLCAGVELLKAANMYEGKEWKGICCMCFKSLCCFPWNLCCCWNDLSPCVITEVFCSFLL
jgi:hypothetical protein